MDLPPIIQAPMAGGPSTPELAAAVGEAGGLGFLAAGYRPADGIRDDVRAVRERSDRPFGLNLLYVTEYPVDEAAVRAYARTLEPEAERYGVELGAPAFDDDDRAEKIALAIEERIPIVSFAFECPDPREIDDLHGAGIEVWVTVTEPDEAVLARDAGADVLVAQGTEAGGHRGTFADKEGDGEIGLLTLLRLVKDAVDARVVAAGGIMDAEGVEAARAAGAEAVQVGTAFMLCPEAGTSAPHRQALTTARQTAITRAFTGRRARGLVNRFLTEHSRDAPTAYPHVHRVTAPIRAAARAEADPDGMHLWAGQGFRMARAVPAADVVRALSR